MQPPGGPRSDRPDPPRVAHFRIVEKLGHGGMGVVYRAEDESLRRTVALKLLPDAGNKEKRQRFVREARSAAAITHPNVAAVHQIGESDGRIYIAMELVVGENLRERLDRGPLDLATARDLASQIAAAWRRRTRRGSSTAISKPENVMITPAGVVKLLDFGLAKSAYELAVPTGPDLEPPSLDRFETEDMGRDHGHARLHVPGAGPGREGRRAVGRLRVRHPAVRDALREPALPPLRRRERVGDAHLDRARSRRRPSATAPPASTRAPRRSSRGAWPRRPSTGTATPARSRRPSEPGVPCPRPPPCRPAPPRAPRPRR